MRRNLFLFVISLFVLSSVSVGFCEESQTSNAAVLHVVGYVGEQHFVDLANGSSVSYDSSNLTSLENQTWSALTPGGIYTVWSSGSGGEGQLGKPVSIIEIGHTQAAVDPVGAFASYVGNQEFLNSALQPRQIQVPCNQSGGLRLNSLSSSNIPTDCTSIVTTKYCGCLMITQDNKVFWDDHNLEGSCHVGQAPPATQAFKYYHKIPESRPDSRPTTQPVN